MPLQSIKKTYEILAGLKDIPPYSWSFNEIENN